MLLTALLFGCAADRDEPPVSIILASEDGRPSPIGDYRDGVLRLSPEFASAFELAGDIDASATTRIGLAIDTGDHELAFEDGAALLGTELTEGERLHLLVTAGSEVIDEMLLVADKPSALESAGTAACAWQYTTITHRSTCSVTMEYLKHSSCACTACWESFGSATWKSGC